MANEFKKMKEECDKMVQTNEKMSNKNAVMKKQLEELSEKFNITQGEK